MSPNRRRHPRAGRPDQEGTICSTCPVSDVCIFRGYDAQALRDLDALVEHVGPVRPGEYVFRIGDVFDSVATVRAGVVKSFADDSHGNEQVLGFGLPGEVIGLNAVDGSRLPSSAVALDTVHLCRVSFPDLSQVSMRIPELHDELFRLFAAEINRLTLLASNLRTEARMAAFLLDMGERFERRGLSGTRFDLPMARSEIANYLRMAPETASRALRRLCDARLVAICQRRVRLLQPAHLKAFAFEGASRPR